MGMSVGPIPWTAIRDYCRDMGIEAEDERADFGSVIRMLDDEFLRISNEKTKAAD